MSVILVLIGASLFVAICFLISFIWAVRTGQYEDKYTPSVRILFDDELLHSKEDIETNQDKNSKLPDIIKRKKETGNNSVINKEEDSKQLLESEQ